ncbi:unnamed protein product [Lactuca saligna]|uniref:Uncharacterized protein n=1 Tax=Lactuca saligna TaxID=75948 RepID=A0AA35YTF1_LACSI|nr:unnamed protein product [Lactuca saligna]
MVNPLLRHSA